MLVSNVVWSWFRKIEVVWDQRRTLSCEVACLTGGRSMSLHMMCNSVRVWVFGTCLYVTCSRYQWLLSLYIISCISTLSLSPTLSWLLLPLSLSVFIFDSEYGGKRWVFWFMQKSLKQIVVIVAAHKLLSNIHETNIISLLPIIIITGEKKIVWIIRSISFRFIFVYSWTSITWLWRRKDKIQLIEVQKCLAFRFFSINYDLAFSLRHYIKHITACL